MSQVKSAATQTFDGKAFAQNMAAMLTGSEQNKLWRSFTRSVLSMMTEISFLLKQAMVGIVGSIGKAYPPKTTHKPAKSERKIIFSASI